MVPYKNVDLIVEAFAAIPDKRLVVIGDGPDFAKVRAKAGPNVQLLGFAGAEVLRDHLQRARAIVFTAEEDFGIASGGPGHRRRREALRWTRCDHQRRKPAAKTPCASVRSVSAQCSRSTIAIVMTGWPPMPALSNACLPNSWLLSYALSSVTCHQEK